MDEKKIKITLKMDWLLFDIANETFLRGRFLKNKDNYKEVASMYANDDDGNKEKIVRSLKVGFSDIKRELSEYLREDCKKGVNDLYATTKKLDLELLMPGNYNESTVGSIEENIHGYLVNSAIGDWYTATNREEAQVYYALAMENMKGFNAALAARNRPERPGN